jgi:hypothetical protein
MKKIKISVTREIILPSLPNFIKTKDGVIISVAQLSKDELKIIGSAWLLEFIKKGKD